ncbi:shikimate dehydrogenase, partial [bacterium]|nr:shikimate dehydrogenase [bacterium]
GIYRMPESPTHSFCVIGHPIAHSLSPAIHGYIYRRLSIPAQYDAVDVPPDRLEDFIREARACRRPGFNVTIPHKEAILPLLDEREPAACRVGAVNTVRNRNGVLAGTNTDVHGCRTALQKSGFAFRGKAVILGAGGAARAAIEAIGSGGMEEVFLCDILPGRAEKIRNHFENRLSLKIHTGRPDSPEMRDRLPGISLLINASPVGMWPDADATPLLFPDLFPQGATVLDMVYHPMKTRLLRDLKRRGAVCVPGLAMLVSQALAADEIFLDRKMPEDLYDPVLAFAEGLMQS